MTTEIKGKDDASPDMVERRPPYITRVLQLVGALAVVGIDTMIVRESLKSLRK